MLRIFCLLDNGRVGLSAVIEPNVPAVKEIDWNSFDRSGEQLAVDDIFNEEIVRGRKSPVNFDAADNDGLGGGIKLAGRGTSGDIELVCEIAVELSCWLFDEELFDLDLFVESS